MNEKCEIEEPSQDSIQVKFNKPDIDLSDLVRGYNMLFNSNYIDALDFFGQKKDTDIRYLMGYTQTLLSKDQIQFLPPYDSISQALEIASLRTYELAKINPQNIEIYENNILDKIPFEENQLFYWSMTQFIKLKYFKYLQSNDSPDLFKMIRLLKSANIDPLDYDFSKCEGYKVKIDDFILNQIFQMKEVVDTESQNGINDEDRPQAVFDENSSQNTTSQNNFQSSSDIKNGLERLIFLKILTKINQESNQKHFDQFQKNFPNFDLGWMLNGDYLIYKQKHQDARHYYDKAILHNKLNSVAVNNKGYSYEYDNLFIETNTPSDRYVRAIQFYKQAIDMSPYYRIYYNNVAVCLQQLQNHSQAIEYFLMSLEINPDYVNGYNRFIESISFELDNEKIMSFLKRSTVVMKRDSFSFMRVFQACSRRKLLPFFNVLHQSLTDNFSMTANFILTNNIKLKQSSQIFQLLEENLQFVLCFIAYSKNLKEYFTYQPSIFLWDLFIE